MASAQTPKINRIIRMTEFDLLRTAITMGNMYMCLDSQKLYYDSTATKRAPYSYIGVKTVNDLMYHIVPTLNGIYYCWEDNSLWIWLNKWVTIYSDTTYPSAYVYDDTSNINPVYRYDMQNYPADDNGLLKDGSVVVRDRQRIIKGKIFIDDGNDNLSISSYLGGGMRFMPNGKASTDGELLIGPDGVTTLRSQFKTLNNDIYVDFSEKPELDKSINPNDSHIYKVYHEGNLDTVKAGFKKHTQVVGGNSKTLNVKHSLNTKSILILLIDDDTGKQIKFTYTVKDKDNCVIEIDARETAYTKNLTIIGF